MNNILISPSLLSADFAHLGRDVSMLEEKGADWIHIDVMDGRFVPNLSFGMPVVSAIRPYAQIPFDVHLMICQPQHYFEPFLQAGANLITFHLEAVEDPRPLIATLKSMDLKVGIAISPDTPAEQVFPYLATVDMVLVMSVYPGFSGQSFIESSLGKIAAVKEKAREYQPNLLIQVDGGINAATAALVKEAGANCLVAGNAVFGAEDRAAAIRALRE